MTTLETKLNKWLRQYAKTFYDTDFGYAECDMVDSAMYDLDLDETDRATVNKVIDLWIVQKG